MGAPCRFALPRGRNGSQAAGGQPAKSVQVLDETGAPLDVQPGETADKVDAALNSAVVGKPSLSEEFKKSLPKVSWDPYKGGSAATGGTGNTGSTATSTAEASGGCTAGSSAQGLGALWLVGLASLWIWRRRAVV